MHEDACGEFYEMIDVLRGAAKQSQWQGYKDAGRKSAPSTRERAAWPRREPRQPLSALGSATLRARSLDRRSARRVVNCVACQGFLLAWHCRATSRQQDTSLRASTGTLRTIHVRRLYRPSSTSSSDVLGPAPLCSQYPLASLLVWGSCLWSSKDFEQLSS